MKMMKRIAAGLIAVSALLSLAACKDTTWSYKIDDTTITSGMYIAYQINAYMEAYGKVEDNTKDILSQKIDDKTAEVWINERVAELCKTYVAVEKKFDELGLTLSDSDKNKLNVQISNYWNYYSSTYEPNGAGQTSLKKILTNSYKSNMIFKKYYDKDGLEAVNDADLKTKLGEDYAQLKYIKMEMVDAEGNKLKTEGKAELKKKAEAYLARLKKGENIDDLIKDYAKVVEEEKNAASASSSTSSDSTSSAASASSADTSSVASTSSTAFTASTSSDATSSDTEEESDPNLVVVNKEDDSLSDKFIKGVFETAKIGEPLIIEDDENYYVAIKYDITKDEDVFTDYRDTLLYDLKGDDFEAMQKEWYKDYKVDTNEASIKRYKLSKLKLS
ncbi:MAG: hypothetical protein PUB00_10550 [Clostridiales bacterium]|nr:hypothetical protein [Clostridiales bacterium]